MAKVTVRGATGIGEVNTGFRFQVTRGTLTTNSVTLNLNTNQQDRALTGVMFYTITYFVSGGERTTIRVDGSETNVTIGTLRANTTYRFEIQAHRANGDPILMRGANERPLVITAKTQRGVDAQERARTAAPAVRVFAGLGSAILDFNRAGNHPLVTLNPANPEDRAWVRVEIIRTNGTNRGHVETVVMQLDANNRVVIPFTEGNRARFQLRVSLVTMVDDVITATTQARNVTVTTLRTPTPSSSFAGVSSARLVPKTTASSTEINLQWFASPVAEVYSNTLVAGEHAPYRVTVNGTVVASENVELTYGIPDRNGRILVTAKITGTSFATGRIQIHAVTADGLLSRVVNTGNIRIQQS